MNDSKGKKIFKITVLVSLLALPTILFYFFIFAGVHKVSRLPFYGPYKMKDTVIKGKKMKDTVYFEIPLISLLRPDSSKFTPFELERKINVVHFLDYAQLDSIPKQIIFCAVEILKHHPDIKFVTYLEHYKGQPIPQPSSYTKGLEGKDTSWVFVVVPDDKLDSIKTNGYFINDEEVIQKPDPYSIVLVDKERRIRGYYNPTMASQIKKANGEISYLKKEYGLNYRTHRYYEYDTKIEQGTLKNKKK